MVVIILGWLSTTCGAFSIHWNNGQCNGTDCSTTSTENNGWSSKGGMEIHIMIDPREDPFSPSAKAKDVRKRKGEYFEGCLFNYFMSVP